MSFIGLVTDSTGNTPDALVKEYGIRVVPLYVKIGNETYRDGVDITAEEFYRRLPHCNPLPTTSQPSPEDFAVVFRELVQQGATGIIAVLISSGVSGTVNSANLAAKEVDVPVEVVDSQCVAAAQVLAIQAAAEAIRAGAGFQDAAKVAHQVVDQQKTVFVLDTLEYLYKGGRIGGAAALVGSLLQFKPVLYFNNGKIDVLERVRKSSRAPGRIVEIMGEWFANAGPLKAAVLHANCFERAQELAALARSQLNIESLEISLITPVLGTHGGPGALGLCCCPVSAFQVAG